MALTPSTVRADLKCGRGSISTGEKCTKGQATKVEPKHPSKASKMGRKLARVAGGLATTAGASLMGSAMFTSGDPIRKAARGVALMNAGAGLNKIGEGRTRSGLRTIGASALGIAASEGSRVGGALINNYRQQLSNKRRASLERAYRGPSAKRDSVYADGFAVDFDQLAL